VWAKKKFLIWGKTYPEFSKTYYETVCTGAVDADTGRLVRINFSPWHARLPRSRPASR
jgi:hypothetical protein